MKKVFVTAALPYANGDLHIGHLLEYIQADVCSRFLRLIGKDVLFVCASDMHGTPIELNAKKAGKDPEQFANEWHEEHKKDFKHFLISFDEFYKTHSKENKEFVEQFFIKAKEKNLIYKKLVSQLFCDGCERFLPDRFVKGVCPYCSTADQYGDNCESCGTTLKGVDLINPKCAICGSFPIEKESEHYFFKLTKSKGMLTQWFKENKALQLEVVHHVEQWLDKLEDWVISRDGPYFGFKIPGEKNKFFYVWVDAPIGYLSSAKHNRGDWLDYWNDAVVHFIGKDIVYFHLLFWPALLNAADYRLPSNVVVHGFLTVNGTKMSKSRGTYFSAKDFLDYSKPEYLRFYFASKLSKKFSDVDLDFENFRAVINNVLIANVGNFVYRVLNFVEKNFGEIKPSDEDVEKLKGLHDDVRRLYQDFSFKDAVEKIQAYSAVGNAFFQGLEPWKDKESKKEKVAFAANLVRNLSILLQPILPETSKRIQCLFGEKDLTWKDLSFDKLVKVKKSEILFEKVESLPDTVVFPLDLRVAKVVSVKAHSNADSLYLVEVDLGNERRQVVAGLKKYYLPDQLLDKKVIVVYNLKPARIRGENSYGMLLAADDTINVELLTLNKSNIGSQVSPEGYKTLTNQISFDDFKKERLVVQDGLVKWNSSNLKTVDENVEVNLVGDGALVR